MESKINVIEKLVIAHGSNGIKCPSLQFEKTGKELVKTKHECDDTCGHDHKILNKKEKKEIKKEYVDVKIKRRLTFINNSIVIDVIKNDNEVVYSPQNLSGENLKKLVKDIDAFISKEEVKDKIYDYFTATSEDERHVIASDIRKIV